MRAMRAEGFRGYGDLKPADIPKPGVSEGRVLVRISAAGVTPLEMNAQQQARDFQTDEYRKRAANYLPDHYA